MTLLRERDAPPADPRAVERIALEAAVARAEARRKRRGTGMATGGVGSGDGGGAAYAPNPFLDQFKSDSYGEFGGERLGEGGSRRTVNGKFYGRPT